MDKNTKIKIIGICVIVIAVLGVIAICIKLFSSNDEKDNTNTLELTSNESSSFTIDDMMKHNSNNSYEERKESSLFSSNDNSGTVLNDHLDNTYQTEDEEIIRLQAALREQKNENYKDNNTAAYSLRTSKSEYTAPPKVTEQVIRNQPKEQAIENKTEVEAEPEKKKTKKEEDFFFSPTKKKNSGNSVPAIVVGDQEATNGSTIRFKLLDDLINEDGITIPRGTFIYAVASFSDNRLQLRLQSVRLNSSIYKIQQDIYSSDGLKGIEIDDNTKAKIAKQTKAGAISNADLSSNNKNIVGKATDVVSGAAKSVLSRENQEIKVLVKSNTQIYLK